ncbi:MAG: iron-containing alcohol dehydrogenase [Kiloniellales bacterium]
MNRSTQYGGVIDALVAGDWRVPGSGEAVRLPIESIVIEPSLDGAEADLVAPLHNGKSLMVVSDQFTRAALGERVFRALKPLGNVTEFVWDRPRCTVEGVEELRHATRHAEALIAVGSGTVSDSVKYATFLDKRAYSVFATSPMNAYTTPTASVSQGGLKKSLTCHSATGVFFDLEVLARCPARLVRAAFADVICRTTAQVDWLLSHQLFDTPYSETPYVLLSYDEDGLLDHAGELTSGEIDSLAMLTRISAIMGLGTIFTGTTHSGSMAEHMMSHHIDMFAGKSHPGTSHGEQVGVTTLTVSALQNQLLSRDAPPVIRPTRIPVEELTALYGKDMGAAMQEQSGRKAIDAATADRINARFAADWAGFVAPLRAVMLPLQRLWDAMTRAGAARTPQELGVAPEFYRNVVRHARFTRDRFTILDLAGDSGELEDFAQSSA